MSECIVFTGGGTGGHVYPALAVLDELASLWRGRVVWIGSGSGLERRILAERGLPYYGIPTGKLRRYFSFRNFFDLFRILFAFFASLVILLREKPVLVFSKGGYVSVPPVAAARLLGIPALTHESDLNPGLATRINSRFAARLFVSFEASPDYFAPGIRARVVHTGNPVRASIRRGDPQEGRRLVGCPEGRPLLLILGGSLGSAFINRVVLEGLGSLTAACFVVHQMGPDRYLRPAEGRTDSYFPAPYFNEELPHLLAAASLVVCRSGANTLWELAACGKPSILVPLPQSSSRGDQIENARFFAEAGAALVLKQEDLSAEALSGAVLNLLADAGTLERMARRAAALDRPEAAALIARLICERCRPERRL